MNIRSPRSDIGRCIYCDSTLGLTDEHVVPLALLGRLVLRKAVCIQCKEDTHKFEDPILSKMIGPLKHGRGISARKKKLRETTIHMRVYDQVADESKTVSVPASHLPKRSWVLPKFERPPPFAAPTFWPEVFTHLDIQPQNALQLDRHDLAFQREKYGGFFSLAIHTEHFLRVLAKIAHGAAVARYGLDGFTPYLKEYIRTGEISPPPEYYVGRGIGAPFFNTNPRQFEAMPFAGEVVKVPNPYSKTTKIAFDFQLFPSLKTPVYGIVVGHQS